MFDLDGAQERVQIGPATLILGDGLRLAELEWRHHAVVSDPPYGVGWQPAQRLGRVGQKHTTPWRDIAGDDRPFDPSPWLNHREVILWGANHYAARLPQGATLIWVKKKPAAFGKFLSDAEIAWKKGGHGVWCFEDFRGQTGRRIEGLGRARHPTQKPETLMRWCITRWTKAETILDPYMGSGTTAVAAIQAGRHFVGCELDREYFEAACERVENAVRMAEDRASTPAQP